MQSKPPPVGLATPPCGIWAPLIVNEVPVSPMGQRPSGHAMAPVVPPELDDPAPDVEPKPAPPVPGPAPDVEPGPAPPVPGAVPLLDALPPPPSATTMGVHAVRATAAEIAKIEREIQ